MTTHSSTLAWKIPWTEEPGRLQSMGPLRVGHDCVTSISLFIFMHWRRKWQPTPVFLPGESQRWEVWLAAVYGVTQSQTWLKRLSSSSIRVRKRQGRILSKTPAVNLVFFRHLSPSKICLLLLRDFIWDWSISSILCLWQKMYKGCLSREVYDISTDAEGVTQSLEVGSGKRVTQPGYVSGQVKFRRHLFYYYFILFEWITLEMNVCW